MPIATRPSSLAGTRGSELSLEEFKKRIDSFGYFMKWEKAALCPNRDPTQPGHHRLNCTQCDENGFVYFGAKNICGLITSFSTMQRFLPESRYEPGTAYLTTFPEDKLSFWDKVTLTKSTMRFTEVIKTVPQQLTYKLKYPVVDVEYMANNLGAVGNVEGDLVEATGGNLVFDSTVDQGAFFTVSYTFNPVYVVIDLPHHVRDSRNFVDGSDLQRDYPRQATIKLDFLQRDERSD